MQKTCNRCQQNKRFTEFPRNAASPDGYYSLCKICRKTASAAYRVRPDVRERERERLRAQHAGNRDDRNARRRARYAANPRLELQRNKLYEQKDPEFWRAWRRSYYHKNKDVWVGITARRRARLLGAPGAYGIPDVRRLFVIQRGRCNCCQCDLKKFEVDHIIPLSRGGENHPRNLQLLCMPCNRSKADKLPHEFAAYRASVGLPQERGQRGEGATGLQGSAPRAEIAA